MIADSVSSFLLPPSSFVTDPEVLAQAAIDGVTPKMVVRPADEDQVAAMLAWATEQGLAVIPRGAGTTLGLGEPPRRADIVLSLERLNQVVEYEPADLTVTAQAGVTLGELQRLLGERGQWLPLDPPHGAKRTLGGLIATGASGPHRHAFGTFRDRVIGLRIAQADGLVYLGGAKVVKNVAGYDIPKLMVGSLGTLGVITEATFKLLPLPRVWSTFALACPDLATAGQLAGQVLTSALTPAALTILDAGAVSQLLMRVDSVAPAETSALLLARFGDIPQAVERQLNEMLTLAKGALPKGFRQQSETAQVIPDDKDLWRAVADLPLDMTAARAVRLKLAVIPSRTTEAMQAAQSVARAHTLAVGQVAYAGTGVILTTLRGYGENGEREARLAQGAGALRTTIAGLGGTMVVEHAPLAVKTTVGVWGPTRSDFRLMRALKNQFDPKGTLNPGRFVGGI